MRIPVFDGNESTFQTWWMRFRAYTKISGFTKAIGTSPETDMQNDQNEVDGLAGTSTSDKKKIAAVRRNDDAMAIITL